MSKKDNLIDPRTLEKAHNYVEKHQVDALMQICFQSLILEQPENPRQFLVDKLNELILKREQGDYTSMFSEENLEVYFNAANLLHSERLPHSSLVNIIEDFGISPEVKEEIDEYADGITKEEFITFIKAKLSQQIKNILV
ncbi:hypothetical protein PCE1_002796 [Barthelona sp. PCE]